jgi:nucleoside-diphosphate-sugar epimerase
VAYFERCRTEQLALIDGGMGLANLIHVDDLVDAMLVAAERPGVAGEAFLMSGPAPVTWREYIGHFARMCGKPLPPSVPLWRARVEVQWSRVYSALTQGRRRLQGMDLQLMPAHTAVSVEKARRLLAWTPGLSLDAGMAHCEAWLRAEGYLPPRADAEEAGAGANTRSAAI